ncbi:MAG: 16S rRNA (cytosine(1402)-N(4))-methyltransferase RsmH [Leptonema sp. (in: bacteria)]
MDSYKTILKSLLNELQDYLRSTEIRNFASNSEHFPVMVREVLFFYKQINKELPLVLDCTLGSAAHSIYLYHAKQGIFYAFERDKRMINIAKGNLEKAQMPYTILNSTLRETININLINSEIKFYILNKRFSFAYEFLNQINQKVDFLICDLGLSMYHLKEDWGFSYKRNALDFRLDEDSLDAKTVLNQYTHKELADILYLFGQERLAKKIAKEIIDKRPIKTAIELKEIIKKIYTKKFKTYIPDKVVQKTFQSLRIFTNSELEELKNLLENLDSILNANGMAVFISFHSLEDGLIKNYLKKYKDTIIFKKPLLPTREEIFFNPPSHSAKMRILWKR